MKYSLQISKNKNLFKRHKYPSPNALNIKHFWTRKNFLEVLIPKTNIFEKKKLSCYEWEPTKSIPAKAKSASYKNLQTRKKQHQQAAANENPKD